MSADDFPRGFGQCPHGYIAACPEGCAPGRRSVHEARFAVKWAEFFARCIPPEASEIQRRETRRAFYAGGAALFQTILTLLEPGAEPTEGDLLLLDDLKAEFDGFAKDLEAGRA